MNRREERLAKAIGILAAELRAVPTPDDVLEMFERYLRSLATTEDAIRAGVLFSRIDGLRDQLLGSVPTTETTGPEPGSGEKE